MKLKADMHLHCKGDIEDTFIRHTPEQLIAHSAKLGFQVLSITCHNKVVYNSRLAAFARKKGILLIPGCERTVEGIHVLLYNFTAKEAAAIKDFKDLRRIKKPRHAVVCSHPFYPHPSNFFQTSFRKLRKNIDVFDALEHCHHYTGHFNLNLPAKYYARKKRLPLIANSDAHIFWQMGTNYSIIRAEKTVESVIAAIKKGRVKVVTQPLPLSKYARIAAWALMPDRLKWLLE